MRIATAVLFHRALTQELGQWLEIVRPAVRVRGGDDDVRHRNAGELAGPGTREVGEIPVQVIGLPHPGIRSVHRADFEG